MVPLYPPAQDLVCHPVTQYCFCKQYVDIIEGRDVSFWGLFCCLLLLSHQQSTLQRNNASFCWHEQNFGSAENPCVVFFFFFWASTSTCSVFTAWKLSTVPLEVSRHKHCRMAVCWTLSAVIYGFVSRGNEVLYFSLRIRWHNAPSVAEGIRCTAEQVQHMQGPPLPPAEECRSINSYTRRLLGQRVKVKGKLLHHKAAIISSEGFQCC